MPASLMKVNRYLYGLLIRNGIIPVIQLNFREKLINKHDPEKTIFSLTRHPSLLKFSKKIAPAENHRKPEKKVRGIDSNLTIQIFCRDRKFLAVN